MSDDEDESMPSTSATPTIRVVQRQTFQQIGIAKWLCQQCEQVNIKLPSPVQVNCIPMVLQVRILKCLRFIHFFYLGSRCAWLRKDWNWQDISVRTADHTKACRGPIWRLCTRTHSDKRARLSNCRTVPDHRQANVLEGRLFLNAL